MSLSEPTSTGAPNGLSATTAPSAPMDVMVLGASWESIEVADIVHALVRAGVPALTGRPLGSVRACVAWEPVGRRLAHALENQGIAVVGPGSGALADLPVGDGLGWVAAGPVPEPVPDVDWISLVHPTAVLGSGVTVGPGSVVGARSSVGTGASLGRRVWLSAHVTVGHDCVLDENVRVLTGAVVSGTCTVGKNAVVGVGATVLQRLSVGAGATVLAGGVVTRDVTAGTCVRGVPARPVQKPAVT